MELTKSQAAFEVRMVRNLCPHVGPYCLLLMNEKLGQPPRYNKEITLLEQNWTGLCVVATTSYILMEG
jgi:hypothetical protein